MCRRDSLKNPETEDAEAEGKEVKEISGSSAYVPKEPEKDTQLQYALSFLRGTATDAKTAGADVDVTPNNQATQTTDDKVKN